MLQRGGLDEAEQTEGLQVIEQNAQAQKHLLSDLLDTSRITSGKLRIERKLVELSPLVQKAVETLLPTARAKEVSLEVQTKEDAGVLWADPDRLHQVLGNLLTNAIKFTPPEGRVSVSVAREEESVQIEISDTGQGIAPEFFPLLFDPFTQAESTSTRTHGGLGLGLAICKELVELHGGTIEARSPGLGQGATFVVRLPLSPPGQGDQKPSLLKPTETPSRDLLKGATILLVEDEPQTRVAFERVLSKEGAAVKAVASAAEALNVFDQLQPRVIVSDIGLPEQDGYQLMQQIRTLERDRGLPATPAIAMTAFASRKDRHQAREAGFNLHLAKPVESQVFVNHVARMLEEGNAAG